MYFVLYLGMKFGYIPHGENVLRLMDGEYCGKRGFFAEAGHENRKSMGRERMPGGGVRNYDNIGRSEIERMLHALTSHGFTITGQNPWHVETHQHGVILKGEWDEAASTLALSVSGRNWYVSHAMVWDKIDSLMRKIQEPDTA